MFLRRSFEDNPRIALLSGLACAACVALVPLALLAATVDPRTACERARQAFARGETSAALGLAEQAIAADPTLPEAHALRGAALADMGRAEEALGAYAEALRLKPEYVEVYRSMALLHGERREYEKALEAGRKVVELDPRDAATLNDTGVAALRLGRLAEAEDLLRRSLELDPSAAAAHYNLALVEAEQGDVTSAIQELELAYQGARQADDQYRREWIVEVCTRMLNRFPGDGSLWKVHRLLGRLYFDQAWFGSAVPHLREGARRHDFYSQLHLGISYRHKALAPEAIGALRAASRLRPDEYAGRLGLEAYRAHNELGHALGMLAEDWKGAEQEFRAALERKPESAEVRYNLAYALYRQERYELARQEFQEAFRLKPDMAESEHYRGLSFPR